MNGRLDLVQAESVLALIESKTPEAARAAARQLSGSLSREFRALEDDVVWLLAQLEADIDFSAEGIEVLPSRDLLRRADSAAQRCRALLESFDRGRLLSDGLNVAIVGQPNVGKSSLLNALLREEKAIVTSEPGTTRDPVEGAIVVGGVMVRLVDTAGLRETESQAEKIGIERSKEVAARADLVLAVLDGSAVQPDWTARLKEADPQRCASAVLVNKIDLMGPLDLQNALAELKGQGERPKASFFGVSSVSRAGLVELEAYLAGQCAKKAPESADVVLQSRHFEVLKRIDGSLAAARKLIVSDSSPEFIAFEMQAAVRGVHELLGTEFDEQVIDRIFKEFCLGK
jgi:tRNA modification GTPase